MEYVVVTLKDKKFGIKTYGVDSIKTNSINSYRKIIEEVFLERHPEITIEDIFLISKEEYESVKETSLSTALYILLVDIENKEKELKKEFFKNFFKNIFNKERRKERVR